MTTTPTAAAGNADGNAMRARLITPEDQPVFPCWIYNPKSLGGRGMWYYLADSFLNDSDTHWHPDQPTAPTCTPQAALSPGNQPAGETKAPQGLREAVREVASNAMIRYRCANLDHPDTDPHLLEKLVESVCCAALAPYVTAQPAPAPAREEGATPASDSAHLMLGKLLAKHGIKSAEFMREAVAAFSQFPIIERDLTTARQQLAEARAMVGKTVEQLFNENQQLRAEVERLRAQADLDQTTAADNTAEAAKELTTLRTLASDLAAALDESSNYWQAVEMHYGPDHLCKDAEAKSLAVRDAALLAFRSSTPAPAPSVQVIRFNINEYFRVKLTPRGRAIHRTEHDDLNEKFPKAFLEYRAPEEDPDGWSKWQAWSLMQTFGPHIAMGMDPPFDTNIEILAKQEAPAPDKLKKETNL